MHCPKPSRHLKQVTMKHRVIHLGCRDQSGQCMCHQLAPSCNVARAHCTGTLRGHGGSRLVLRTSWVGPWSRHSTAGAQLKRSPKGHLKQSMLRLGCIGCIGVLLSRWRTLIRMPNSLKTHRRTRLQRTCLRWCQLSMGVTSQLCQFATLHQAGITLNLFTLIKIFGSQSRF